MLFSYHKEKTEISNLVRTTHINNLSVIKFCLVRVILGRYPIHFHMCEDVDGDEATRPWIKHNSIHHSNSRCVTIHGTHGLIVSCESSVILQQIEI